MTRRGRFAPSPTGPLHLGSLATALAGWLDARANGYLWFVRMEDLDTPREEPGAAAVILHQLRCHGLHWDPWVGEGANAQGVLFQSRRHAAYQTALETLIAKGRCYPCTCSRKRLQAAIDSGKTRHNPDGEILYPGFCRSDIVEVCSREVAADRFAALNQLGTAWRFRSESGDDFVVRRADGFWAYQLAVVVDDSFQGITNIVRGDDLLHAAPRQTELRRALGTIEPAVFHVPVVRNELGEKLSKQTLAPPLRTDDADMIRMQIECAWSHLELTMTIGWVARVRGVAKRLIQELRRAPKPPALMMD